MRYWYGEAVKPLHHTNIAAITFRAMGRTLPSITQVFLQEQSSFTRFRRALRRGDQTALDELFAAAHQHLAAAAYAGHAQPFEVFLLAMLLEEHKEVLRLRREVEGLHVQH
jgi:hypothetical protein